MKNQRKNPALSPALQRNPRKYNRAAYIQAFPARGIQVHHVNLIDRDTEEIVGVVHFEARLVACSSMDPSMQIPPFTQLAN